MNDNMLPDECEPCIAVDRLTSMATPPRSSSRVAPDSGQLQLVELTTDQAGNSALCWWTSARGRSSSRWPQSNRRRCDTRSPGSTEPSPSPGTGRRRLPPRGRMWALSRRDRPYQCRDLDGTPITQQQARDIANDLRIHAATHQRGGRQRGPDVSRSRQHTASHDHDHPSPSDPTHPPSSTPQHLTGRR